MSRIISYDWVGNWSFSSDLSLFMSCNLIAEVLHIWFPQWLSSKESTCNAGDTGLILVLGRFPRELQYSTHSSILAWKFHGQRSLVGYSPKGHKESDMTEQLSTHLSGRLGAHGYVKLTGQWVWEKTENKKQRRRGMEEKRRKRGITVIEKK